MNLILCFKDANAHAENSRNLRVARRAPAQLEKIKREGSPWIAEASFVISTCSRARLPYDLREGLALSEIA
jgi:hypothetical protein